MQGLEVWAEGPDGKRYRLRLLSYAGDRVYVEFIDGHRAWINIKDWKIENDRAA